MLITALMMGAVRESEVVQPLWGSRLCSREFQARVVVVFERFLVSHL
jgi:hypothetical protein